MNTDRETKPNRGKHPMAEAGFVSRLSFWWLFDMFRLGLQRPIVEQDVYECLPEHRTTKLSDYFETIWNVERTKAKPSLFRAIRKIYARKFLFLGVLFNATDVTSSIILPQCLGGLVVYFSPEGHHLTAMDAKLYVAGIIGGSFAVAVFLHSMMAYCTQIGMRIRQTCISMVYKKTLRLTKSSTMDGLDGHVINLISNDMSRFDLVFGQINALWKGPLFLVVMSYFVYREIGYFALIAVGMVVCSMPMQMWMGKQTARFRAKTSVQSGRRVRFMNEILQAVQVIKMYTWEKPFAKQIDFIRRKELKSIRASLFISGIFKMSDKFASVATFLCLIAYVNSGNVFTARQVYIITAYMNSMFSNSVYFWSHAIQLYAEAMVSIGRIEQFLLLPENKDELQNERRRQRREATAKTPTTADNGIKGATELDTLLTTVNDSKKPVPTNPKRLVDPSSGQKGVFLTDVAASWLTRDQDQDNDNDGAPNVAGGVRQINVSVPAATLCTIIGTVGSGKSTILQVILGELELDVGCCTVNGSLSYASQEAWLFEGSIRQNIVFVEDFDESRYNEVVKVCALKRDFELFPHGDATIVGERGNNLSGGQRARVNLARAIYKRADIYLLDDPLSAVDTHVGKHIFEKCIVQYLKDKVCVLVTHQLQYLRQVEHIVVMSGGQVEAQGTYNQLRNTKNKVLDKVEHEINQAVAGAEVETVEDEIIEEKATKSPAANQQSDNKELHTIGPKGLSVYTPYFASVNNVAFVLTVFALILLTQASITYIDLYISKWATWEGTVRIERSQLQTAEQDANNATTLPEFEQNVLVERSEHTKIYIIGMIVVLLCALHRIFAFFQMCVMASRNLHDQMFRGVTRAPMAFFNANPSGRILNRFSKDIDTIDTLLPMSMFELLTMGLMIAVSIVLASQWNPWMLVPTFLLGALLLLLLHVYMEMSKPMKRIEALSRSPVLAHTNATLQGLATIRAFNAERTLTRELETFLDFNSTAGFLHITGTRAFGLWVELTAVLYLFVVLCILLWAADETMGSQVGLIITQLFVTIKLLHWTIRQQSEVTNQMINVHRVVEYANLPAEPPLESDAANRPSEQWPTHGAIRFERLSMRYTENGTKVLHDLNIAIGAEEKIGIVGRTGAGKSSIIQALFRLAHNEGVIRVDGVDIERLGLHDLRSKISIIPQNPILFSGTMRHNLDPFEECSDEEIWKSLALVDLKETVSSMPGGLEARLSDGGSNFSLGQRQLVCLARAILRKNRILILDEATANVDSETDRLIQSSIREYFGECTVLTIAHRLHTIMDSDRVLVMDDGHAVEFDRPSVLLQRPDGHLSELVRQTGQESAAALVRLANGFDT